MAIGSLIIILLILDIKHIFIFTKENKCVIVRVIGKIVNFIKDWRNFLAFVIAWMITNGWSYAFLIIGAILKINWMKYVGGVYLAFLWLPFTPEKLITIPLAVFIKKSFLSKRKNDKHIYKSYRGQHEKLRNGGEI